MKKLLLASTAVVMSAGVAAADVSLSGDAWMGLTYNDTLPDEVQMISRARVLFTLSGETDHGMAFGASFRAHETGSVNGTQGSVYISGDFGKLSMGSVDSGLEATWFNTRHIGVLENAGTSRISALGAGTAPRALYEYSIDGFKVAASVGQFASGAQSYGVGASYTMDGYGIAVGYERNGAGSTHILLSGQVNFDPVSVRAFAGRVSVDAADAALATALGVAAGSDYDQYGADLHASFDEIGVQLRGKRDFAGNNHIGAGVTYSLGGGATLGASVNRVSGGATTADVGLSFSF